MKTINPFKRLNKEDFIPCSLFPASKVCDTSLDIGRATPLYCLDMVAGNRVSLDLSQLTRFQPMIAPVMTNYSIEYGAFFVPYVAFDEFFQSTWFRTHCQNTDVHRKAVLRAREFFNPAIDNSEKVHPWNFSTKRCGDKVAWVGSLYDHLRAPLGLPDWSVDKIYSSVGASADDSEEVNAFLDTYLYHVGTQNGTKFKDLFSNAIYGAGTLSLKSGSNQGVLSPFQILVNHPEFIRDYANKRTPFLDWISTGSYTKQGEDLSGTPVYLSGFANDIGNAYKDDTLTKGNQIINNFVDNVHIGTILRNPSTSGSPCSWSPLLSSEGNFPTVDFSALIAEMYFTYTGKRANGSFGLVSATDPTITYTAQSSKQTTLYSLISDSVYSQFLPLLDSSASVPSLEMLSGEKEFYGFLVWVVDSYHLLDENSYQKQVLGSYPSTAIKRILGITTVDEELSEFRRVYASLLMYFFGVDSLSANSKWFSSYLSYSDMLGKNTISQVQGAYRSYVEALWISANRNLEWNSVYWLAYQRIFADWFLNEHYTKHEDYLDLVGAAYIAGAQSLQNGDGKTMTDWFTAGDIADGNNPKLLEDPTLSYFGDRIAKGECMPVLWSLDCVTNLRQSTSTSSTPIGQSITENFYNRFYARFKDLINRMGPDYRRNARALYGKGPDDASLLRSQVVGYKSFDMQIGDVAQNSESTKDSTLGQFAGYAVSRNRAGSFDWTAQESGVFVVLAWVRPKYTCFADLVPRSLYKSEYMDYLIPQFGGVGYQDFAYKQLNPTDANPDSRLGYEERYSEYMMLDNECSGLMRTSMAYYNSNRIGTPCYAPNTADFYHLLYMDEESDLKRVFVDNFNDPVLVSAYFNGNVTRQLPATIKTEF